MVRLVSGLAVALVGAAVIPACGPARRPSASVGPAASPSVPVVSPAVPSVSKGGPITKIVLERWPGGGPAYDWQVERLVLRRPDGSDPRASEQFERLSDWLERSGFFSRPGDAEGTQSGIMVDPRGLVITVTRGGRSFQVRSLGGMRDNELWETETLIRGTSAALTRYQTESARLSRWYSLQHRTDRGTPLTPGER